MKNLAVISSYPEKDLTHGNKTVGVASYAKNTLKHLKSLDHSIDIEVYAEIFDKKEAYEDDGVKVKRMWRRGSLSSIFKLFLELRKSQSKNILAQFEMYMMGGFLHASLYLLILFVLKLTGRKIYIVLHQVVQDVDVFEKNKVKAALIKFASKMFYKFLVSTSTKTIVFEQALADPLNNQGKVLVIPHAVEKRNTRITKSEARKILKLDGNSKYAIYFGFLSPYKGVDDLIEIWDEKQSDTKLIIAGGSNPNHKDEAEYINFIESLYKKAKSKGVNITGFLPEEKISLYFTACDVLILPYKTFISSSGPLSLALTYGLPFLLSEKLKVYFRSADFTKAASKAKINESELVFPITRDGLRNRLDETFKNYNKNLSFVTDLKEKRDWSKIASSYYNLIFS